MDIAWLIINVVVAARVDQNIIVDAAALHFTRSQKTKKIETFKLINKMCHFVSALVIILNCVNIINILKEYKIFMKNIGMHVHIQIYFIRGLFKE